MNIIDELTSKRKKLKIRPELEVLSDYKNMCIIRSLHHSDDVYATIDEELEKLREELLLMYFPLIITTAKRYKLDLDILFSAGIIGLYKAIDKFDVNKNIKFTTFIIWKLKNEFRKEFTKLNDIYIPLNFRDVLVRYKKLKNIDGFNFDEFVKSECIKNPTWNFENTKTRLLQYEHYSKSEIKPFHAKVEPEEINEDLSSIWKLVENLVGYKYCEILKMYLDGKSFAEIGDKIGISKQRCSIIYWNVIAKLKKNPKLFIKFA